VRIARRFGARLVLEHNIGPRPPDYMAVRWMWSKDHGKEACDSAAGAEKRLQELLHQLPGDLPREARLTHGPVESAILMLARDLPADLIIMGSHGRSTPEHRSLTEQIIARATCPVLTMAEGCEVGALCGSGSDRPVKVLVPVDFAPQGLKAAHLGLELAAQLPWHLTLLHVGQRRAGACARLAKLVPPHLEQVVTCRATTGRPDREILRTAQEKNVDLILMGSGHMRLLRKLKVGPNARSLLHDSACPIWFVPPRAGAATRA
jgi:nucleotide-binding universal stress UspA family protein